MPRGGDVFVVDDWAVADGVLAVGAAVAHPGALDGGLMTTLAVASLSTWVTPAADGPITWVQSSRLRSCTY
jgi:hypothetical protein